MQASDIITHNKRRHVDRGISTLGIVNPIELAIKRCASNDAEAVQGAQRAHTFRTPYQHIPTRPRQDAVVGTLDDGRLARVRDVELVWNDKLFIDHCFGQGAYKSVCRELKKPLEVQLLDMAEVLYTKAALTVMGVIKH